MPGVVDTTHVFATNQVITSTLMNNIIDETTFTSQALAAGTSTLALVSGRMKVATGGIAANELATDAVTNTKIFNDAVTTSKILDDAVTTAKILNLNVTTGKIEDGAVTTGKIEDAAITAPKLNGAQTGTAPIFGARAYGAFIGTATSPIAPINAGNITSITRNSTGIYTVVMAEAMLNANYCVVANEFHNSLFFGGTSCSVTIINNSSFSLNTLNQQGLPYNPVRIDFVVFQ